jgi:hypothetical protein
VPDPKNPQSFNRYSYCLNNPLRYVDPTGHGEGDSAKDGDVRESEDGEGLEIYVGGQWIPVTEDAFNVLIDAYNNSTSNTWQEFVGEYLLPLIPQGTIGEGLSISVGFGIGLSYTELVVRDNYTNLGIAHTICFGGATPNISIQYVHQITDAKTINGLSEWGVEAGGSVGYFLISANAEYIAGQDKTFQGNNLGGD